MANPFGVEKSNAVRGVVEKVAPNTVDDGRGEDEVVEDWWRAAAAARACGEAR